VHDHHDQIHGFRADLRAPAPAGDGEERRRAPLSVGKATSRDAASVLRAENQSAFNHVGITATHFAPSSTSAGTPLSGVAIISCSTLAAAFRRSTASTLLWSAHVRLVRPVVMPSKTSNIINFFIRLS